MSNPKNNQNQAPKSMNQQGSGSRYHEEHASKVTGYGELDPNAEKATNMVDNSSSP